MSTPGVNIALIHMEAEFSIPEKCKLVAFDLDGTVWYPDMYMCNGPPFKTSKRADGAVQELKDRGNESVRLLGITHKVLSYLKYNSLETIVAWVSCTDEPEWAAECLQKFTIYDEKLKEKLFDPIGSVVKPEASQIYKANKQHHFKQLKSEFPKIEFEEMLFFDNEMGNIRSVSKLGVKCVYCPDGVTEKAWKEGMGLFS
jgi:magnesium-dependent phosphatase 1